MNAPTSDLNELVATLNVAHNDLMVEKGGGVDIYFDTSDVRRAVLGAYEYITWPDRQSMQVNKEEFKQGNTLVACLLAAKLLGPFAMLPPHQAEFLRQIKNEEAFQRMPARFEQADFLKEIGIHYPWGLGQSVPDKDEVTKFLHANAGARTELFFKAIQCIRMPWWDQLRSLRSSKTFVPVSTTFQYSTMLENPLLSRLVNAFQLRRNQVTRNNFADAIALLMLIDLARSYSAGERKIVPRFFDSSGTFHEVAKDVGILHDLTVSVDNVKSSILMNQNYFVYRASLSSSEQQRELYENLLAVPTEEQSAQELRRIEQNLPGRIPQLHDQLQQFLRLSFLENVWLKTLAYDDVKDVATRWTTEAVRTEDFRAKVDQTIDSTARDVLKGAVEYRRFSNAWLGLREYVLKWRKDLRENPPPQSGANTEIEMGLFRFNATSRVAKRVRNTLTLLADDTIHDDEITYQHVWHELVACCVAQEGGKVDRVKLGNPGEAAEYAIATLWAIKADNRICDLFRSRYRMSFFTTIVYAAAVLRQGWDTRRAEKIVHELQLELDAMRHPGPHDVVTLDYLAKNSSVAYLWFHIWQATRNLPPWWRVSDEGSKGPHPDTDWLLDKALVCVDVAWKCSHSMKRDAADLVLKERLIYVTNQRLYYLTEQGAQNRINDMKKTYDVMQGYETNAKALWRATYSDTLARYFAFRAYMTTTEETWRVFIKHARSNYEEAAQEHRGEHVIRHFGVYLADTYEAGFIPKAA